jgi:hypothetical protein
MNKLRLGVVDRMQPGCAWEMRRHLSQTQGEGFGKWLASEDRGRFLIVDLDADTMEEWLCNVPDEAALIEELSLRVALFLKQHEPGSCDITIEQVATPDIKRKVNRLVAEIDALVKTGKPPPE